MRRPGSISSPARLGNHRDRQSDSALFLVRPLNLAILSRKRRVSHYSRRPATFSPDMHHRKLIFARTLRLHVIRPHPSAAPAPRIGPYDSVYVPHDGTPTLGFLFPPILLSNIVECSLGITTEKTCKSRAVVDLRWIQDGAHESGISQ